MAFSWGKDFRCLDLQDLSDLSELKRNLDPQGTWISPASWIYSLIEPLCRTVIIENNYHDEDYSAAFARFYYLRHYDTPRRCVRLHFFSGSLSPRSLLDMSESVKNEYLGFIIIRPLPDFVFSRSLLSPNLLTQKTLLGDLFITCAANYRANVIGNEIWFRGVPWLQQDTLISACASASLWIANCHMAHKFPPEFSTYHTAEITDLATKQTISTGRAMPSMGLTNEQMMQALQSMGYDPVPYIPSDEHEACNIAYRYVESGIPLIVGLFFLKKADGKVVPEGHTVTMVGHTFNTERTPIIDKRKIKVKGKTMALSYCRTADFVPSFLVQDDAGGPFRELELVGWDSAVEKGYLNRKTAQVLRKIYSCVIVLDPGTSFQEIAFLGDFIVPLPKGVSLDGYAAEERAIGLISSWVEEMNYSQTDTIAVRTFLQRSGIVKDKLAPRNGIPSRLSMELRRHLMPKWIWVTEAADLATLRTKHCVLGQVIQDSASHPTSEDYFDLVAFNMPGTIALHRPDKKSLKVVKTPYYSYPRFER